MLTYGAEVWGYDNTSLQLINRTQVKFFKILLKLNKSTPNCIVYGELGLLPSTVIVQQKLLYYWASLVNSKIDKYSCKLYNLLYNSCVNNQPLNKWIQSVKTYLDTLGMSYYWINQTVEDNVNIFKNRIKLRLSDIYKQKWSDEVFNNSKCMMYRIIKSEHVFDKYLLSNFNIRATLCKFRSGNHKLPIVKGRYENINRAERFCLLCNQEEIGDEYHYLFVCPHFNNERKTYLKRYFYTQPNTVKMYELFNNSKYYVKLSQFITVICANFK